MAKNPNEHYDFEAELRQIKSKEAREAIKQFLIDQATDPFNYIGAGAGKVGKAVGKGMFALAGAGKSEDAEAMFFGGNWLPKAMIETVERGLKAGKTPEEIFRQYGYFKTPKGEWRAYTSDMGTSLKETGVQALRRGEEQRLRDVINSPLFNNPKAAYDVVGDIPVKRLADESNYNGWYQPSSGQMAARLDDGERTRDQVLKTLTHEPQHHVQKLGGVSHGATPEQFIPKGKDKSNKIGMEVFERINNRARQLIEAYPKYSRDIANVIYGRGAPSTKIPQELLPQIEGLRNEYQMFKKYRQDFRHKTEIEPDIKYRNNPGEVEARVTANNINRDFREEGLDALLKEFDKEITNPLFYKDPFPDTAP